MFGSSGLRDFEVLNESNERFDLGDDRTDIVFTIRTGDSSKIGRLIDLYRPYLRSLAQQNFPDQLAGRLDQSDLVQEALLRATRQLDKFLGTTDGEFAAWLKQILLNLIVDQVRSHTSGKRDIRRETPSAASIPALSGSSPTVLLSRQEDLERLAAAIQQLSEDQRQVTELRSQGQSFEEIGQRMGRSADASRVLWGRAVTRLLKILDDEGDSSLCAK